MPVKDGVLTRNEFSRFCSDLASREPRQGPKYLQYHMFRFWATYRRACDLLPAGGRFVSVGAGSAYVEAALANSLGASGVVIDFPEAIVEAGDYYASLGLTPFAADLAAASSLLEIVGGDFDLALSCEVIEHLPVAASAHITALSALLKSGGSLLVTTPNAGSLRRVIKTALHMPVLPPAELTFAPSSFETEGVHRREYMATEIDDAFRKAGLGVVSKEYISYGHMGQGGRVFGVLGWMLPPCREAMNLVGQRGAFVNGAEHHRVVDRLREWGVAKR